MELLGVDGEMPFTTHPLSSCHDFIHVVEILSAQGRQQV